MNKLVIYLFFAISIFSSCYDDSEPYFPTSSGTPGHILIIMEKQKWKYGPGKIVREMFNQPYEILPQNEPVFDYSHIPPEAFSSLLNKTRNIFIGKISVNVKKPEVIISKNVHAKPQMIITVKARNNEEFEDLIKKNANKIIYSLTKAERERLIGVYSGKFPEKKIHKTLKDKHNIILSVPQGYTLDVDSSNFMWLSRETPTSSQGILIWTYPYTDTLQFSLENLIAKRDSICKKYVPGPKDSTYMTTEMLINPSYAEFMLNKNYAVMIKGLWKITGRKDVFLGGPFVEITIAVIACDWQMYMTTLICWVALSNIGRLR